MERFLSWLDISLPTANKFYTWGWAASLIGAAITFVAVIFLMWGTRVRDRDTARTTANLELRAEELRNANLLLEKQLVELKKNVRGREITDQQHDQIIAATKGMKVPEMVTYIVRDPEAHTYGISLVFLFQEIGMRGLTVLLDDPPPMQTGVMYCGSGTPEDAPFMKVLMDAGIVGVGATDPEFGHDKDGKEIVLPYCPRGSVFVGLRPPLSEIRSPRLKALQKQNP